MSVKLIAFDLDGTFLDEKKNIPPENLRALEKAAEKGVHIVPATGRIYKGIPEALRELPFMRWFITANGSYIYDAAEDRAAARAEIPAEQAVAFYEYADTLGVLYDCYQDNWGYMTASMLKLAPDVIPDPGVRKLITGLRAPVPELKAYLKEKGTGVQKLQLYFTDMDQRARELEELPKRFPDLIFSTSMPFNIEINARTATKGQCLMSLCKLLGIEAKDTMALGDGTNDLDMLQKAGVGVAMGNAAPELLAAADFVTLSNNEAGFAKAVEKFIFAK
jgi:Cof subfamily protein (haloacid dehalogenase superfamily)